jgi:ribosomal protein S15P/S13E
METVIAAGLSAIAAIITCVINNNIQRVREQAAIERKIDSINANYDKQTALITQQIVSLTEHVNKHNNVIERLYDVEKLTIRLQDMVNELREDDRR